MGYAPSVLNWPRRFYIFTGARLSTNRTAFVFFSLFIRHVIIFVLIGSSDDKSVPGYCHGLRVWCGRRARFVTAAVSIAVELLCVSIVCTTFRRLLFP